MGWQPNKFMGCPNCGVAISPGSTTCPSCGTPQNVSPSPGKIHTPNPRGFCGSCGTSLIAKYSPCPNCGHVKTTFNPQPNPGNPNPPQCTDQKKVEEMGFWESLFLVLTTQPDYTVNNDEQTAKDQAHQRDK